MTYENKQTEEKRNQNLCSLTEVVFGAGAASSNPPDGFPLPTVLQNGLNVTVGNVSSLAGFGGNSALLQMTAPVQPGNSGGPLLDRAGNVVGVIVSKLDALEIMKATGDIPQNINFAVQGTIARLFLEAQGLKVTENLQRRRWSSATSSMAPALLHSRLSAALDAYRACVAYQDRGSSCGFLQV